MKNKNSIPFKGFDDQNKQYIRVPEAFFTDLLTQIDDLNEIRLLLYLFWHAEKQESQIRHFNTQQLQVDQTLLQMVGGEEGLHKVLHSLVNKGILLKSKINDQDETLYFFNSEQGRTAFEAIENNQWQEPALHRQAIQLNDEKPNIFRLYEANIGAITPMMAEILKEDEATYPLLWIEEAIQIAVARNARNWKYVQAILERWQKEGRCNEQNRKDGSQDPESYRKRWGNRG